jgi:hypothetical protein
MTRTMIVLGAAVLVAALVLAHLANLVASDAPATTTATTPGRTGATMARVQPIERTITVEPGKPIAAGLPPWTKRLATLRTPPPPDGTAVPVVPDYSKPTDGR